MFKFQPHILAVYLTVKSSRAAFVSFSALPDPDGVELQQQKKTKKKTEQRQTVMESIAANGFLRGRERMMDTERLSSRL